MTYNFVLTYYKSVFPDQWWRLLVNGIGYSAVRNFVTVGMGHKRDCRIYVGESLNRNRGLKSASGTFGIGPTVFVAGESSHGFCIGTLMGACELDKRNIVGTTCLQICGARTNGLWG